MDVVPMLVALFIIFLFPAVDRGRSADLRRRPTELKRLRSYRHGLLALWVVTAAALAAGSGWQPVEVQPGSAAPWLAQYRRWVDASIGVFCVVFLLIMAQGLWHAASAARRKAIEPAFARLAFLLPVSPRERRWWVVLSVSAGVCEELLYRGYLFHFLDAALGPAAAWLLGSLAFGFAHAYQGWRGIASAAAMGGLFGLLAIGTGSLALPIVVHVLVDLQVLWMYRPGNARKFP